MFWKHNYFLLKAKDSQENVLKESFYKKWLFLNVMSATILCNVRNTKLLFAEYSLEQGFMEFVFDRSKI